MNVRIKLLEVLGPAVQRLRLLILWTKGYRNIHSSVVIERGCNLDRTFPEAIHVAKGCLIASRATILSHEHVKRDAKDPRFPLRAPVSIGENTFIGVGAMVLPGVSIGRECLIGAGAVVTKSIPDNSVAVGVPAKVVETGITMTFGAIRATV